MFGSLGLPEILLIFVVALLVFGPRKLPEIGRSLGKALGEFKKATDELKNTIQKEVQIDELKQLHPAELVRSISRFDPLTTTPTPIEPAAETLEPTPPPATPAVPTALPPSTAEGAPSTPSATSATPGESAAPALRAD